MFDKLYKMDEQYDYISVFDADNLVDKNYLKAMNERANQGFKVVQGFLDSKTHTILGLRQLIHSVFGV